MAEVKAAGATVAALEQRVSSLTALITRLQQGGTAEPEAPTPIEGWTVRVGGFTLRNFTSRDRSRQTPTNSDSRRGRQTPTGGQGRSTPANGPLALPSFQPRTSGGSLSTVFETSVEEELSGRLPAVV